MKWQMLRLTALWAVLLGGPMFAQPPTLIVDDYLKEVRIFRGTSPDFAKIASSLGVDATLPTLGPGASLVAAVRNDSGGPVELRIVHSVTKGGSTIASDLEVDRYLQAGETALVAPQEIVGALEGLLHAGRPGLFAGSPTVRPLDRYQGATITVSIDSATLANGKFIGADTRKMFDELVAEDKARKKFFSDLTGWLSSGKTQAQIIQTIQERLSQIQPFENQAAITLSGLLEEAQNWLERRGMAFLSTWAASQSAICVNSKPSVHR